MKNTIKVTGLILAGSLLASCATAPNSITATYVSPSIFQNSSCLEIARAAQSLSFKADHLLGVQNKRATSDAITMGVGLFIFWPALLFVKGNGGNKQKIARLKGQMEAIEQASLQKNCDFQFGQEQQTASKIQNSNQTKTVPNSVADLSYVAQNEGLAPKNRKSITSILHE